MTHLGRTLLVRGFLVGSSVTREAIHVGGVGDYIHLVAHGGLGLGRETFVGRVFRVRGRGTIAILRRRTVRHRGGASHVVLLGFMLGTMLGPTLLVLLLLLVGEGSRVVAKV